MAPTGHSAQCAVQGGRLSNPDLSPGNCHVGANGTLPPDEGGALSRRWARSAKWVAGRVWAWGGVGDRALNGAAHELVHLGASLGRCGVPVVEDDDGEPRLGLQSPLVVQWQQLLRLGGNGGPGCGPSPLFSSRNSHGPCVMRWHQLSCGVDETSPDLGVWTGE